MVFCGVELRNGNAERTELVDLLVDRVLTWSISLTTKRRSCISAIWLEACPNALDEKLFRFEFPERPGALLDFLKGLSRGWNISLFHYRNHGAAYGRVLVGVQLDRKAVQSFEPLCKPPDTCTRRNGQCCLPVVRQGWLTAVGDSGVMMVSMKKAQPFPVGLSLFRM